MNLATVMDAIANRLATITGLRAYAWPQLDVSPPAAIVAYPEDYAFDATYGRGMDRMTLQVVVLAGLATERTARDTLGAYVNGSGASSVKAVLESGTYTAFHTVRVTKVDFDIYQESGQNYLAGIFDLDIVGQGS